MGYSPAFDTFFSPEPTLYDDVARLPEEMERRTQPLLRFAGLTMDPVTGATYYNGRRISLAREDRELLSVLLRRAGQIIRSERLATMMGTDSEAVDQRVQSLRKTLKAAGAGCMPYRAEGLGYVLWRA